MMAVAGKVENLTIHCTPRAPSHDFKSWGFASNGGSGNVRQTILHLTRCLRTLRARLQSSHSVAARGAREGPWSGQKQYNKKYFAKLIIRNQAIDIDGRCVAGLHGSSLRFPPICQASRTRMCARLEIRTGRLAHTRSWE